MQVGPRSAVHALAALAAIGCGVDAAPPPLAVTAEETVYTFQDPANGSGPMWCFGSTCLVRAGGALVASGQELIAGAQPLNNVRCLLFERTAQGWVQRWADPAGRTREPSPLVCFPDGRVFMSVNPTLSALDAAGGGPACPQLLQFPAADLTTTPQAAMPGWSGTPQFTEHSYRSFAADGPRHELLLLQNVDHAGAEWAFRDASGAWGAQGQLKWPWGEDYEEPEPIRLCYPSVALRNRAVHFMGVSDIVEPNRAWRAAKRELTRSEWDYDFRRLFYAWSPDVTTGQFSQWIEVASREKTCGWVQPCDLWVAPDGAAHLLWTERALDERLRDRFYPGAKQSHSLEYAIVRQGEVVLRRTLIRGGEDQGSGEIPGFAHFQATPSGRLFVFYFIQGAAPDGRYFAQNRAMELYPDGTGGPQVVLPVATPLSSFFTATERAGCLPSSAVDVLGQPASGAREIRYLRLELE
jgi:hypothetical protein